MQVTGNYPPHKTLGRAVRGGIVTTTEDQPSRDMLARRLRELREREFTRITQGDLGRALDANNPVSTATISMWENPASGRLPPEHRLEAYARLFCTERSFEREPRVLGLTELTTQERERMEELRQELLDLREAAREGAPARVEEALGPEPQSMWHFPDRSRITLVCSRLPEERMPQSADRSYLNYVRLSGLADVDTLMDIYGAVRAYNPTSRVFITAAQDLTPRDVANHLVLVGGLAWETVPPSFSRIFPIPIEAGDPFDRGAIVVHDPSGADREFKFTLSGGELVEDVGVFARGENPAAPQRTLTICGGVTTRGVRGAARCFIDREMRENNERYLIPRFPPGSTYCIVMKVPVFNGEPITPDLSKKENRLYEWCDSDTEAE